MDPTFLTEWGPWAFIAYILIKDILPKLFPQIVTALSKRVSTEDRLFTVLEANASVLLKLNQAFVQLADTLKEIDHRISLIETNLADNSSALKVASRLIKD
jgi:uncharacterized protein YdcH (DUF465 family)